MRSECASAPASNNLSSRGEKRGLPPLCFAPNLATPIWLYGVVLDPCKMSTEDFVDIAQTSVLALVALAQIYTILILRNELSRAAKVLHGLSTAMGEQKDSTDGSPIWRKRSRG